MVHPISPLMGLLKALSTEYIFLLYAIPISLIDLALLALIDLGIPFSNGRILIVRISILIFDLILPDILARRPNKIFMIIYHYFLFFCGYVY